MKKIHQTILKPPHGNCLAACVASVIGVELDQVPNFVALDDWSRDGDDWKAAGDGLNWWRSLGETAVEHGYRLIQLDHAKKGQPAGWGGQIDERDLAIASVQSPRGDHLHCVVASIVTGQVIHDPYPEGWSFGHQLTDDDVSDWLLLVKFPRRP